LHTHTELHTHSHHIFLDNYLADDLDNRMHQPVLQHLVSILSTRMYDADTTVTAAQHLMLHSKNKMRQFKSWKFQQFRCCT